MLKLLVLTIRWTHIADMIINNEITIRSCIQCIYTIFTLHMENGTNYCKKRQKWRQQMDDALCPICASWQQILQQKHRKQHTIDRNEIKWKAEDELHDLMRHQLMNRKYSCSTMLILPGWKCNTGCWQNGGANTVTSNKILQRKHTHEKRPGCVQLQSNIHVLRYQLSQFASHYTNSSWRPTHKDRQTDSAIMASGNTVAISLRGLPSSS